jgi:hypothetical protein
LLWLALVLTIAAVSAGCSPAAEQRGAPREAQTQGLVWGG